MDGRVGSVVVAAVAGVLEATCQQPLSETTPFAIAGLHLDQLLQISA
jgi:hypothetical protein